MPASPTDALALFHRRRSVPSRQLGEPAPDAATLTALLEAAIRVPDHGKLVPFRLIALRGEHKRRFGERLAARAIARHPEMSEARRDKERLRYTFAPLVIVVVSRIDPTSAVPPMEQQLSAGCVAYNLLLGAEALGFGAQWLTGWAAYDTEVASLLGLAQHEQVIGFVHLGSVQMAVPDRERPALGDLLRDWSDPR
ncbi:nitroreductase family protein [Dyella sp. KRB-257]|uniref:nitroreductase family protein n=1 Tax=Dyella sp. KRB-257 TaxID=3400915 RepID=UPI003C0B4475